MKTLLMTVLFLSSVTAFASCETAIQASVEDVKLLNTVLGNHDVPEDLEQALKNESGLHRQVILNCKVVGWETKQDYCSVVPKLLIQRHALIKSNSNLSRSQKGDLNFLNSHNQELARIVCP